ncbi:MAG: guanylate kinase [Culicoidibacterales bacterium]
MERGLLIVMSGPSGVGKGTIREALFATDDANQYRFSVSATTRSPRAGEEDGVSYYFKTKEAFETMIQNDELIEYAQFVNNYYGTPKQEVNSRLEEGYDVFLEIEVDGAMQVKEKMPEAIFIFIAPPSIEDLTYRLEKRATETSDVIQSRVETAKKELEYQREYDYVVINDDIDRAVAEIKAIINQEHNKRK